MIAPADDRVLYLIEGETAFKIGVTTNPRKRFDEIRRAVGGRFGSLYLRFLADGAWAEEAAIIARLVKWTVYQREWFSSESEPWRLAVTLLMERPLFYDFMQAEEEHARLINRLVAEAAHA